MSDDPTITIPLHDLCDLLELAFAALGEDGMDDLSVEDDALIRRIGGICTKALVSGQALPADVV